MNKHFVGPKASVGIVQVAPVGGNGTPAPQQLVPGIRAPLVKRSNGTTVVPGIQGLLPFHKSSLHTVPAGHCVYKAQPLRRNAEQGVSSTPGPPNPGRDTSL